jgi:hypothetical protein
MTRTGTYIRVILSESHIYWYSTVGTFVAAGSSTGKDGCGTMGLWVRANKLLTAPTMQLNLGS